MNLLMEPESILLSIFRTLYKRRSASAVEATKPRLKWLPKYQLDIKLPAQIFCDGSADEKLEILLGHFGFEIDCWTKTQILFSRGKKWGDFSIKLLKLRISFPMPLTESSTVLVEVADVCLFDTGDLWSLTSEIKAYIEVVNSPNAEMPIDSNTQEKQ